MSDRAINWHPNPMFIRAENCGRPKSLEEREVAIASMRCHPDDGAQAIARRYETETTVDVDAVAPMAASLTDAQIASWRLHGRRRIEVVEDEELSATGRASLRLRTGRDGPPR